MCDTHLKNGARRIFFSDDHGVDYYCDIDHRWIPTIIFFWYECCQNYSCYFLFLIMTWWRVTLTSGDGEYSATNWWTTVHSTPCSPIFLGRAMRIGTPTISPPVSVTVVGKCNRMVPSFPLTNILCGIPSLILRSVNPISSSGLKKMRCESDMRKF